MLQSGAVRINDAAAKAVEVVDFEPTGTSVRVYPEAATRLLVLTGKPIGLTKDEELNCEQCRALVAEFAERKLAGRSIPESLQALEQHLSVCAECHEEYEALERALKDMDD